MVISIQDHLDSFRPCSITYAHSSMLRVTYRSRSRVNHYETVHIHLLPFPPFFLFSHHNNVDELEALIRSHTSTASLISCWIHTTLFLSLWYCQTDTSFVLVDSSLIDPSWTNRTQTGRCQRQRCEKKKEENGEEQKTKITIKSIKQVVPLTNTWPIVFSFVNEPISFSLFRHF